MAKLEIHNLSLEYTLKRTNQAVLALQAVDLTVQNGEFVAIVGPSGCGKTTLLNLVAGLWPITQGKIHLDGRRVQGPGRDRAMVFQTPALLPWRSVQANVGYGLALQGYPRLEIQARVQRFIELVGLAGFEESYPHELSGGMQQRVNLARALAVEPSLLLLDEPLSAVDAQTREILQMELQRIWLATRHSALYVTHQIDEAIFLADKVVVMATRPGRIQAVIKVDLPRPRPLSIKRHPTFITLSEQIWQLLQRDSSFPRMEQ